MMKYREYLGRVEYDDEAGVFHGEVINLRDVVTFQGETVPELRRAFQESVNDYLAFCIERNEEPGRPYSGTFTVCVPPELHRDAVLQARLRNKSLISWVAELLADAATERRSAAPAKVANVSQSAATPLRMGEAEAETIVTGEKDS